MWGITSLMFTMNNIYDIYHINPFSVPIFRYIQPQPWLLWQWERILTTVTRRKTLMRSSRSLTITTTRGCLSENLQRFWNFNWLLWWWYWWCQKWLWPMVMREKYFLQEISEMTIYWYTFCRKFLRWQYINTFSAGDFWGGNISIYFLQEISEELEVEFDDKELDLLLRLAGEDEMVMLIMTMIIMMMTRVIMIVTKQCRLAPETCWGGWNGDHHNDNDNHDDDQGDNDRYKTI